LTIPRTMAAEFRKTSRLTPNEPLYCCLLKQANFEKKLKEQRGGETTTTTTTMKNNNNNNNSVNSRPNFASLFQRK
jgi:hypothetical protein